MKKLYYQLLGINNDFKKLFFKNEYQVLSDKSNKQILVLVAILFLTFVFLGFSVGSYRYLQERMENPFTNWVDWPVSFGDEEKVYPILASFSNEEKKEEYNLDGVSIYHITKFPFLAKDGVAGEYYMKRGRVFDLAGEKALIYDVLNKKRKNVIRGISLTDGADNPFYETRCGIVVTETMLKDLGYDINKVRKLLLFEKKPEFDSSIYLDIIAVVKELPNNVDFLCTRSLYNSRLEPYDKTNFIDVSSRYNYFSFISQSVEIEKINGTIQKSNPTISILDVEEEEMIISTEMDLKKYTVTLDSSYTPKERQKFINNIEKEVKKNPDLFFQKFTPYSCIENEEIDNPHYTAFNFRNLRQIEAFDQMMQDSFDIEISMTQIEAANNFAIVSWLTQILSFALLIFSIISIVFYVNSLLRTHLEKMKMNLGTFKAFGLSDADLKRSYLNIIITFILRATILAFLLSCIVAVIVYFIMGILYIDIFNIWILGALLILIFSSLFLCNKTIVKILDNTPGDLIYNRV